jgi:CRISPR-associated endonuclease/helicase Cas3
LSSAALTLSAIGKEGMVSAVRRATPTAGRILIATQVIEAGVDISSALMVTDLAPWPSMVQRFGRCNRDGKIPDGGEICWVDRPPLQKSKPGEAAELTAQMSQPYEVAELALAEQRLVGVLSGAPADLPEYQTEFTPAHVLRRRDIIDLFDTTADLSGYDLDVSRFIRHEQDRDVLIAWGDSYPPRTKEDGPTRDELCSAPIGDVAALLTASKRGKQRLQLSTWNALDSAAPPAILSGIHRRACRMSAGRKFPQDRQYRVTNTATLICEAIFPDDSFR